MAKAIVFETPRLRLRQWRDADLEPFAALNADPRVMTYFPRTLSRAGSDALAQRIRDEMMQRGWGLWALEAKNGPSFVGFVGLHVPTAALPFAPCVEIGWRLACAYWRRGYATEAARGALAVGFGRLALDEIVSFTTVGNQRSRAVMQRLGMYYDGSFEHPDLPVGHTLRRHVLYRLRG